MCRHHVSTGKMMFRGIYFGLGLIFFVILTIKSFASAAPRGSIDFAAIPGFAAIRDAYCHDKGLDPAAEGSANCRCYWEFAGSNKIMLKDILPKACEKISSYEYGFEAYASRVMAPIPPTLIMAEYNREFRGEACKGPRRMTQEQCEKNFRNATCEDGRVGGFALGGCFKYTIDFYPSTNHPDIDLYS